MKIARFDVHYYKRNLGDYAKKAGRLTMLQHGAYTLLLDACYDREQFPTMDQAVEWTWASTTEEVEAVAFVLKKFFVLEGELYVQNRIREELETYHNNAQINKRIAIEREAKRKEKTTKRVHNVDEPPPNHKPITNNQEPKNIYSSSFEEFWQAYPSKTGKGEAYKSWKRVGPDKQLTEKIIASVDVYKDSKRVKDGFVKNPATWLNQRCWEDEVETVAATSAFAGDI
jgi:uncharacterized protein YdaU (DUF1376 family)